MTQTGTAPAEETAPIDRSEPLNLSGSDKIDLTTLLSIQIEAEGRLDAKILERNKAFKEYLALEDEFRAQQRDAGWDPNTDPLFAKLRTMENSLHALNAEIESDHAALLPIRGAIVAKKNELAAVAT